MNESTIRRLIKIVEESDIESLEITRFFRKIRITKKLSPNGTGDPSTIVANSQPEPVASTAPPVSEPHAPVEEDTADLVAVVSPMVGTFYRSPSPDSDSFVEIGTRVNAGDTICIVEAMKLMNEIEAEVAGVIKEIKVENTDPVEYGQTLFLIDPKG
jgi:acetyl-CoA carboxylase biotin carboxyl carrier protein